MTVPAAPQSCIERPSRIPGAVVWRRPDAATQARILPDGCIDVIWASD